MILLWFRYFCKRIRYLWNTWNYLKPFNQEQCLSLLGITNGIDNLIMPLCMQEDNHDY